MSSLLITMAATLAWLLAEKADFGMSPARVASPRTKTSGFMVLRMLSASIGHQPLSSVRPAACAISPAFCGGTTFATSASCTVPSLLVRVIACGSTATTSPPKSGGSHSIMSG